MSGGRGQRQKEDLSLRLPGERPAEGRPGNGGLKDFILSCSFLFFPDFILSCVLLHFCQNVLKYLMTEAKERKQAAYEHGWTVSFDEVRRRRRWGGQGEARV